jgi:chromosome segregation ATPase
VATYRAAYQGRIDAEENILKQLEDELKGLQGEKGKLEKSIREKERSITGNEEKIEENKLDAERISKDIEKQKDMVHEFRKDPEKEKLYKKELQSLKKQKNRMLKDREKLYGGIDDHKEAIRKAEADIEKNNSAQQAKENEIAAQKDKIAGMEVVLKKIK